jgi:hypothetical protein
MHVILRTKIIFRAWQVGQHLSGCGLLANGAEALSASQPDAVRGAGLPYEQPIGASLLHWAPSECVPRLRLGS